PEQKREIPITKDEFLIGRGTDCDLRLPDGAISRHHCLIRVRGKEATISDLGSSNGTYVNGQRVRSQAALRHGDEIALDAYRFKVAREERGGIGGGAPAAAPNSAPCRARDSPGLKKPEDKAKAEDKPS